MRDIEDLELRGYRREGGVVGFRNHVVILPTSVCSSETAVRICGEVEGTVALPHQHGCCQIGADLETTRRTLTGLARNPNVAAVLVVSLGCETLSPSGILDKLSEIGKPADHVTIQEEGGSRSAVACGAEKATRLVKIASGVERREVGVGELTLAIECGGSDATSGLAANPVAGRCADRLIESGGTVIFSETTELVGAEHLLARRATDPHTRNRLLEIVDRVERRAKAMGVDLRGGQPTPGNIEGGLTTIEEKSLGCVYKGGGSPLMGVLEYAEPPPSRGLHFMDTPGQDIESITGMLAGGAQLVIFTTGRGTPTGSPIAPVIKVTGNAMTWERMRDHIDFDASAVLQGAGVEEVGDRLFECMLRVASGHLTKAERLGHREFAIHRISSSF